MSIEPLESRKTDNSGAEAFKAFARQFLHGHLAHELVHAKATLGACKTIGGQDVIRTTAVVAD